MRHIGAISGGKDSVAMALLLREQNPDVNYEWVCTLTGNEPPAWFAHMRIASATQEITMPLWKHKKRGHIYEVLTDIASLQCSAAPEFEANFEDDTWTVYRNVATGAIWVRPTPEFLDGRFEEVAEEPA